MDRVAPPTATAITDEDLRAPSEERKLQPVDIKATTAQLKKIAEKTVPTRRDRARDLWNVLTASTDTHHRYKAANELLSLKKTSKVSWDSLGIDAEGAEMISKVASEVPPAKPATPPKVSNSDRLKKEGTEAAKLTGTCYPTGTHSP